MYKLVDQFGYLTTLFQQVQKCVKENKEDLVLIKEINGIKPKKGCGSSTDTSKPN